MPGLDALSAEGMEALVGTRFRAAISGTDIDLELTGVERLAPTGFPQARPAPFALTLHGPQTPQLAQGTFDLAHSTLGVLQIFLVPIGADSKGPRYYAVFN